MAPSINKPTFLIILLVLVGLGFFLVTCLGAVRVLFVQDFGAAKVLFCPVRLCF